MRFTGRYIYGNAATVVETLGFRRFSKRANFQNFWAPKVT